MGEWHEYKNSKFITTEILNKSGQKGESQVWDAVKSEFAERECLAYWRYPIFSQIGNSRKEPDILIADFELGLIIIEVKSITIDQIINILGHRWEFRNFYTNQGNPYEQAENQLFSLLGYSDREPTLRRQISGRVLIALPFITQEEWKKKGFHQLPSCPPIIFKNHLSLLSNSLYNQIIQTSPVIKGKNINEQQWKLLLSILGGKPVFRKPKRNLEINNQPPPKGSRADILNQARQHLSELDLIQENIGKQIPPGAQRIRGIAGSGKTVLLCQKAACMHLKYPEWDIALVFFSRSLYTPIIKELDKWLRRFSSGEVQYFPNNQKLRVIHAWGAKNQPGFYSIICEAAGLKPLSVYETDRKAPHESLAEVCNLLLKNATIPQIFDAILIDEGQDLIVNNDLKFQDKQPFYWLAYQALKPLEYIALDSQGKEDFGHEKQRRLIWAYDEAQSLESLIIPTASELFGDDLGNLVTGEYPGGIKKTEIMHRCYRTPESIVTVSQALGMGLLRPGGMLSGMTRKADWQRIGYEVNGRFSRGNIITLKRHNQDSVNIIPQLWKASVIDFEIYPSRQQELSALSTNILNNLNQDYLQPSPEILVIVLGSFFDATRLENHVAEFLMLQGIKIFIPGAQECNILKPQAENRNPNKFWCEGAVTVSRIHRAKGHEADMVYIVGCDHIAKDESNIVLRNQLFVALTRTRAWVKLSGIGNYLFYQEVRRVLASGDTFTFTFNHHPKRQISVTDAGELLTRYAAGDRNFQGLDLRGIQLAGADLRNANFINTQFNAADLRYLRLDGAKMAIADLSYADLSNASLKKTNLMGANLRDTNLRGADLSRANLSDADLSNAQLVGAKLTGANLNAVNLSGADLTGADINTAELHDINWIGAKI